ncbi:MAG: hypothetical protein V4550_01820 [Gemmatimonadota bacterium]
MNASAVLALLNLLASPPDTARIVPRDSVAGPVMTTLIAAVHSSQDTVRRRRKAIEVSEWYEQRLRIHRYGAYAIAPLFVLQSIAGEQLYDDPKNGPAWAKNSMRYGATALAGLFTSNSITGLWNLWDSRHAPGGTRRTIHALLMLSSDAGFTYAGSKLADEAENSADKRGEHRKWAYGSMAATVAGVTVIRFWPED